MAGSPWLFRAPPPAVIVAVPEGSAVLLTSQILTVVVFISLELAQ